MLILQNSCFLHVPKTGGLWVKKAIIESNLVCHHYTIDNNEHVELKDCPCLEKFKFAFVRCPTDFYRSYWQYKMTYEWDSNNPFYMECQSNNFHKFIRNVLEKFPGAYSQWVTNFVGQEKNEIEFIGKFENLVGDLIFALNMAGETFDEEFIRNFPPYNVNNKKAFPATYTGELEDEVRNAESNVIKRFYN